MPEQKIDFHADVEVYFCYLMIIIIKYDKSKSCKSMSERVVLECGLGVTRTRLIFK